MLPVLWLVAANLVWLAAGVLAYATRLPMLVGAALAAAVATPGLWALRRDATGEEARLWADRGFSYAVGTWTVLLVVVLLPLITFEEGGNLWGRRGYWAITLVVASVGFLLLDTSAFRALAGPETVGAVRSYALFHAALLVVALWALWSMDHALVDVTVAGEALRAFDLRMAPALAAVPGLTWALAFWRLRTVGPGSVSAP